MEGIKKRYLVDEKNRRVGVVLDLRTFERIEEILEDHLFGQIMLDLWTSPRMVDTRLRV